jgi:hypothetical protein
MGRPAGGGSRSNGELGDRPLRGSLVAGSPSLSDGVEDGRPVRGSMGALVGNPLRGSVRGVVGDSPVRGSTVVDGEDGGAGVSTGEDGEPTEGIGDEGFGRAPGSVEPVWAGAGAATSRIVPTAKISGRGRVMGASSSAHLPRDGSKQAWCPGL